MAIMMLIRSRLKLSDMSLLTLHVAVCVETSNLDIVDPEGSSPCGMY
jgi:hypothetical protein